MSQMKQLQRKIMRRVYYAFAIRLGTHPLVLHSALFAASIYGLSVMVHVASIIKNLRSIQVGNLDNYVFHAFTHTDFLTLFFVGLTIFTLLSLRFSLKTPVWAGMQTA